MDDNYESVTTNVTRFISRTFVQAAGATITPQYRSTQGSRGLQTTSGLTFVTVTEQL